MAVNRLATSGFCGLLCAVLPAAPAPVSADALTTQAAQGAPSPSPMPPDGDPEKASDDDGRLQWRDLSVRGRLLGRFFSDRDGESESDFDLENARLELRWRPSRSFQAVVEGDAADSDRPLKDAFASYRPGAFELRAGQFKPPVSPIELLSRMNLPASERGLMSDLLGYSFGITGRRPGVQVGWDPKGRGFSFAAGVFRASSWRGDRIGDEAFDNIDLGGDWDRLQATGRLAYGGRRSELGLSLNLRPAEPIPGEGFRQLWTAGADLTLGSRRRGGPRVWAEGYVGSSWQDANAFDGQDTTFVAGRALVAWRLAGDKRRALFLEPYAMASLLEPDTSVVDDLLWEASGGLHAGGFGRLRFVLEIRHRDVARNAPPSLGLLPFGERAPRGSTRLVAQIGAAF
jgi:hypothetical protein